MRRLIDLTGQRFGKLVVVEFSKIDKKSRQAVWACKCDCGKYVEVLSFRLRDGRTKSCGCIRSESSTKHGMSFSRFYGIYSGIKNRCKHLGEHNKNYFGKGIKICKRWEEFENFKEDMYKSYLEHVEKFGKKNTTIDRIDNSGNYCKENCRWATYIEQQRNTSSNVLVDFNGRKMTITEASLMLNGDRSLIHSRLKNNWSLERAINTPVRKYKKSNKK